MEILSHVTGRTITASRDELILNHVLLLLQTGWTVFGYVACGQLVGTRAGPQGITIGLLALLNTGVWIRCWKMRFDTGGWSSAVGVFYGASIAFSGSFSLGRLFPLTDCGGCAPSVCFLVKVASSIACIVVGSVVVMAVYTGLVYMVKYVTTVVQEFGAVYYYLCGHYDNVQMQTDHLRAVSAETKPQAKAEAESSTHVHVDDQDDQDDQFVVW